MYVSSLEYDLPLTKPNLQNSYLHDLEEWMTLVSPREVVEAAPLSVFRVRQHLNTFLLRRSYQDLYLLDTLLTWS